MKEKTKLPLVCAILFFCAVPFILLKFALYSSTTFALFLPVISIAIGVGILLKKDLVIVIAAGVKVVVELLEFIVLFTNDSYPYELEEFIFLIGLPLQMLLFSIVFFLFVLFLFLPKYKNKENIAKLWIFPTIMFLIYSNLTISNIILSVAYFMLFYIYSKRDYNTDFEKKNDKKIPVNQANEKPALDIVTSLKILKAKLDAGSITEEEYNSRRKDLLGL